MNKWKIIIGSIAIVGLLTASAMAFGQNKSEEIMKLNNGDVKPDIYPPPADETITVKNGIHPGTVAGSCKIWFLLPYEEKTNTTTYKIYIDEIFHSNSSYLPMQFMMLEGSYPPTPYRFDNWDTTKVKNGLHELKIMGENDEIVESIIVFVQN